MMWTPVFPQPPGYSSMKTAQSRAQLRYGKREADGRLLGLLISGKFDSYIVDRSGQIAKLEAAFWQTRYSELALDGYKRNPRNVEDLVAGVLVLTADMDRELPPFVPQAAPVSSAVGATPPVAPKGGRPPNVGADEFWIEICRRFHSGEAGAYRQTQEQLVGEMIAWIGSNKPGLYTDDTVRDKVKAAWKALGITKR